MELGIPGIGFRTEKRRFYPGGATTSHIVGLINIDNQGIAGMEKIHRRRRAWPTCRPRASRSATDLQPVKLSIDLRVQHIVRDEIVAAMDRYHAIAAGAVVLNVKTGEVVAMASVPDFDPNNPFNAQDKDRLNRMSAGLYEMGSTFKSFTTAMALDSGKVTIDSTVRRVAPDHHRPPDHPRLPRQGPRADRAGGVHLLVQHRLGARGRRGRHRGPSRVPAPPGPARPHADRTARGGEADRAEGLEEGELDHHRLRPRRLDDAAADGGRRRRR